MWDGNNHLSQVGSDPGIKRFCVRRVHWMNHNFLHFDAMGDPQQFRFDDTGLVNHKEKTAASSFSWPHFQEAFESFEREFVGQIPIDFGIRVVRAVRDIQGRSSDELTVRSKDLLRVLSQRTEVL